MARTVVPFEGRAVVAVRAPASPAWHERPRRARCAGQLRGVIGAVGVVHQPDEADDLCGCRDRIGSSTRRTIVLARSRAGTSHPSTRHPPAGWRRAWLAGETGAVAWRVPGGSSGHARATPDGSWIRWRYRRFRQPESELILAGRVSAKRGSFATSTIRARSASVRACEAAGSRPAAGRRVSDHRSSASVGWCADRCPPERRQEPSPGTAGSRPRRLGQSGSGDLPGGSCVLAFVEDRSEFF